MNRKPALFFAAMLASALWVTQPWAQWGGGGALDLPDLEGPVVVELFTSQSCSSCPPADEVLGEAAAHENVIALGCHVTYWDHLNWKDRLSLKACTDRQRAYAAAFGTGRVYTPQAVINGEVEFVGANRGEAKRQITAADGRARRIALTWVDGTLSAEFPTVDADPPLTLWLATWGPDVTQAVRSGENGGKTLHYVRPVTHLVEIGAWDGRAAKRRIALPTGALGADVLGVAVLAQTGRVGPVLAAGQSTLPH